MAKQVRQVNIPRSVDDDFHRYKMPELIIKNEGKGNGVKTVIVNNTDVARALKRPAQYLHKWFGMSRNTPILVDVEGRNVINGTFNRDTLAKDLDVFIDRYVLCSNCANPETTLTVKKKAATADLRCKACGSLTSLKVHDKFGNYILKNPPPPDASEREHKAMESERGKVEEDLERDIEVVSKEDVVLGEVTISADTTEAAVAARRAAMLKGTTRGNILMSVDEMSKDEVITEVRTLLNYHKGKDQLPVVREGITYTDHAIGVELSKLHVRAECDVADVAAFVALELPLPTSEQPQALPASLHEWHEVLKPILAKEDAQRAFLISLARRCRTTKALAGDFGKALFGLFQEDVFSENVIVEWYQSAAKKKRHVEEEETLLSSAGKFVEWLQTEDSEDEEEED